MKHGVPQRRDFILGAAASIGFASCPVAAAEDRLDERARACAAAVAAPGFAYGAVRGGQAVHSRGIGVRRLGGDAPVTADTLFHMASVTKTFVATLILQMAAERRFKPSDRLAAILPEFKLDDPRSQQITLEQLLLHTSGLPDVEDYGWSHPEKDADALRRYLQSWREKPLLFVPGSSWAYSNLGYEVLARIIETHSGRPFEEVMRSRLLEPAGMARSTLYYPDADRGNIALPHGLRDGNVETLDVWPYNRAHAGSSTLISCANDMLHWLQLHLNDGRLSGQQMLSENAVRQMRQIGAVADEARIPFGWKRALGWFVWQRPDGDVFLHTGKDDGFCCIALICPKQAYGLVAMTNRSDGQAMVEIGQFARAVVDEHLLWR